MMADELLNAQDLITAKKHDTFHSEVITGKAGGVSTGADIDYATNAVTGQTQTTLPKVLSNVGFSPAGFDFTTGGTLTERDKAIFYQTDGNWYSWGGTLPKVVPPASSPASTGGIADNTWNVSTSAFMYRDWEGFTAELLAQAGIVDDGQPDEIGSSQRVDALHSIFDTYGTVADIEAGKFKVGKRIIVTNRANGVFEVKLGGTADGISIIDAGGGNTAALIEQPWMLLEYLGETGIDDAALFSEASRLGYRIATIQGKTYQMPNVARIYAGTFAFFGNSTFINPNQSGAMFCNGELGNPTYATGYDGDGNIELWGGVFDCNGVDGGVGFAGGLAFGHGQNIKMYDPVFKNATGTHYIELNACKDVFIYRPRFLNHYLPLGGDAGFYEDIQIDHMGDSIQFGFFGSYDGTPCENIHIIDFCSESGDVVVGTHTPTSASNKHKNIFISGISKELLTGAVSAMTWDNCTIDVTTYDCARDQVKLKGGCSDFKVKINQKSLSAGALSIFKAEEVTPLSNTDIMLDVISDKVSVDNVIRLNNALNVVVKGKVTECNGGAILANNSTVVDVDFTVNNGATAGGTIATFTDCTTKTSRLLLGGITHGRPLVVTNAGLTTGDKNKFNGVVWSDGVTGDGQPTVPLGVELNGLTRLMNDPNSTTGTAVAVAHNVQNFDYFLIQTGTASGGDLVTSVAKPYSFADTIAKPIAVNTFSGFGTITFPDVAHITWNTGVKLLRGLYGVTMK